MYDTKFIDSVKDKRCVVCQSALKMEDHSQVKEASIISFTCSLAGNDHYIGYLNTYRTSFEEESAKFFFNGKEYNISQYWNDPYEGLYFILISIYDNNEYHSSMGKQFSTQIFDFLNDDLSQVTTRIKTILTFQ